MSSYTECTEGAYAAKAATALQKMTNEVTKTQRQLELPFPPAKESKPGRCQRILAGPTKDDRPKPRPFDYREATQIARGDPSKNHGHDSIR